MNSNVIKSPRSLKAFITWCREQGDISQIKVGEVEVNFYPDFQEPTPNPIAPDDSSLAAAPNADSDEDSLLYWSA